MIRTVRPLCLAVAMAGSLGCATGQVRIQVDQLVDKVNPAPQAAHHSSTQPAQGSSAPSSTPVAIWIAPTDDHRPDKALGLFGNTTISLDEMGTWIDRELTALSPEFGLLQDRSGQPAPQLLLYPRVLKAYLMAISTTRSAVVVLEVQFVKPSGETTTRTFRGQSSSTNMFNTESEWRSSLKDALHDCLEQLRKDLRAQLPPPPKA